MDRATLLGVLAASFLGCATATGLDGQWIDLTHPFDEDTVYWPTAPGFELSIDSRGLTDGGYWYEANSLRTSEHGGTHLDAPVHFAKNRHTTDQVPLERLVGPAVVLDLSAQAAADRNYRASIQDFESWEANHGRLPTGAIVLLHTGFSRYWPDRERYMGTAERGPEAVAELSFPGLSPSAARWLVAEREIDAIGLDTPSIDYGRSKEFLSHRVLFARNIPVFENVANLDRLPPVGAFVVALPMKIAGGSGGPLRIVALVP